MTVVHIDRNSSVPSPTLDTLDIADRLDELRGKVTLATLAIEGCMAAGCPFDEEDGSPLIAHLHEIETGMKALSAKVHPEPEETQS